MVKQFVFAMALVAVVSQAHAIVEAKDGKGEAQAQRTSEEAKKAKDHGAAIGAGEQQIDMTKYRQKLDKYFGDLTIDQKDTVINVTLKSNDFRESMESYVKSRMNAKRTGSKENNDIDGAFASGVRALAKIKDLDKKLSDGSLKGTEKAAYNLVARVTLKARTWSVENKAVAAEALNIFGEASKDKNTSLDEAWTKMETDMANHKDAKLRANINKDAVEKWCS